MPLIPQNQRITLAGVGLCSALGGYADACAAARTGLARLEGDPAFAFCSPEEDEPSPLTVAPCAINLQRYQGLAHTIKLLEWAWRDFLLTCSTPLKPEGLHILMAMSDPYDREMIYEGQEEPKSDARKQATGDFVKPSLPGR